MKAFDSGLKSKPVITKNSQKLNDQQSNKTWIKPETTASVEGSVSDGSDIEIDIPHVTVPTKIKTVFD